MPPVKKRPSARELIAKIKPPRCAGLTYICKLARVTTSGNTATKIANILNAYRGRSHFEELEQLLPRVGTFGKPKSSFLINCTSDQSAKIARDCERSILKHPQFNLQNIGVTHLMRETLSHALGVITSVKEFIKVNGGAA